ncbi:efflux RND transporter periplasmic adaptor subunit [Dyella sp. KRB-257]|uniref:efflux RND transporter periplasmic adaptor subunit n=1 Tax=Dyella sp. KRB-257 TaxID=3400915 RepID=UPI003C0A09F4
MKSNLPGTTPASVRANRWPRVLALGVLAASGAAFIAGCSHAPDEAAAAASVTAHNVTLTPAQRRHIHLQAVAAGVFHASVHTTGRVDFDNERATGVLAPFSGPVTRLLVAPGDTVARGQVLATVDSSDFAAAVGAYRKALVAARNARRIADMDADLARHDGVSAREAAQASTDAASAEADRDAALQALRALGVDSDTIRAIQHGRPVAHAGGAIRAPIAGTVVERLIAPGQLLQAGSTACFTLADLSRMWVMAQVTPAELAAVHVGDRAEISTGANAEPLTGTVTNIGGVVNADTGLIDVRVAVDNRDGLLKKQMYVDVTLRARQASHALLVPASAVLRDDENLPFVYVAQTDGGFARQHVTPGDRSGGDVAIRDGLKAGQRVVVDGGIFVQFLQNQ